MPKAIYEGIYREIRSRIIDGTYAFQEMLPTEAELTAEFGCTRNTVRRALSMLADQMFVQPIHGKGVRVIWLKGETDMLGALEEVESFGEFAKRNNAVASTEVKSFEHLICTEQLSRRLGFKVGEELIRVVRVRSLNGSARQVDHGYFLASIAKGLTPEIAADSIYGYLEHKRGIKVMASRRTVSVELANDEDCSYLDLGKYNCVASWRASRTLRTASCSRSRMPARIPRSSTTASTPSDSRLARSLTRLMPSKRKRPVKPTMHRLDRAFSLHSITNNCLYKTCQVSS